MSFRNFPEPPTTGISSKSIAGTNGRRTGLQIGGGLLQYKLEVCCGVSLSSRLGSQQGTALQMGDVRRYKLQVYFQYFSDKLYGLGAPMGFCRAKFWAKFPFWRGAVRGEVFREVCREVFHEVFGLVLLGHSEQKKLQQKLQP